LEFGDMRWDEESTCWEIEGCEFDDKHRQTKTIWMTWKMSYRHQALKTQVNN